MEQEKQIMTSGIGESQNYVVDLTKVTSETEPRTEYADNHYYIRFKKNG